MLKTMPIEQSILICGNHGIGKSQIVKQAAVELGVPIIDFRLSQNDVGDLKGMPFHCNGRTVFAPPEYMPITEEDAKQLKKLLNLAADVHLGRYGDKGILFLDEMNRACREVQQAAFELVLDRRLNLRKLPDGWRVVSAINDDDDIYTVNAMEVAFLSRFFLIKFDPTIQEWMRWAEESNRGGIFDPSEAAKIQESHDRWNKTRKSATIHPSVMEFIRKYPEFLDPSKEVLKEAASKGVTKVHDRRAWEKFSNTINKWEADHEAGTRAKEPLSKEATVLDLMTLVATGFVGHLAGIKFRSFIETDYQSLDANAILNKMDETVEGHLRDIIKKGRIPELASYNELVIAYIKKHVTDKLTDKQKKNLSVYINLLPNELIGDLWQKFNVECKVISEDWYNSDKGKNKEIALRAFRSPDAKKRATVAEASSGDASK
jgi:MoxR-like ATPase